MISSILSKHRSAPMIRLFSMTAPTCSTRVLIWVRASGSQKMDRLIRKGWQMRGPQQLTQCNTARLTKPIISFRLRIGWRQARMVSDRSSSRYSKSPKKSGCTMTEGRAPATTMILTLMSKDFARFRKRTNRRSCSSGVRPRQRTTGTRIARQWKSSLLVNRIKRLKSSARTRPATRRRAPACRTRHVTR